MYSITDCYNVLNDSSLRNSGVYCIENKTNDRQYIGSTINPIFHRIQQHICYLKKGIHHSKILQRSFDKYGIDVFSLKVLEVVLTEDISTIRDREQYWIDTLKPYYNILIDAKSPLGYIHSEEVKEKQSQDTRDRFRDKETGVKYYPKDDSWGINIRVRGFRIYALGRFKTKEEALIARKEAESIFWTEEFDNLSLEEKKKFVEKYRKSKPVNNSKTGFRYIVINKTASKLKHYRFHYTKTNMSRFFLTLEEAVAFRNKYLEENNLI